MLIHTLHPSGTYFIRTDAWFTSQADADDAALSSCVYTPPALPGWKREDCFLFARGMQIVADLPSHVDGPSATEVAAATHPARPDAEWTGTNPAGTSACGQEKIDVARHGNEVVISEDSFGPVPRITWTKMQANGSFSANFPVAAGYAGSISGTVATGGLTFTLVNPTTNGMSCDIDNLALASVSTGQASSAVSPAYSASGAFDGTYRGTARDNSGGSCAPGDFVMTIAGTNITGTVQSLTNLGPSVSSIAGTVAPTTGAVAFTMRQVSGVNFRGDVTGVVANGAIDATIKAPLCTMTLEADKK